jgi:hypothetical protein
MNGEGVFGGLREFVAVCGGGGVSGGRSIQRLTGWNGMGWVFAGWFVFCGLGDLVCVCVCVCVLNYY